MYTDEELARWAVLGDHYATAPGKVINSLIERVRLAIQKAKKQEEEVKRPP